MFTSLNHAMIRERQAELARAAEYAPLAEAARSRSSKAGGASPNTLVMLDGTPFALRQVRAEDRALLAALFARLTPESRRRRFLSAKRRLTVRELAFFTDIDHRDHEAIGAFDRGDGSMVGVARYVREARRAGVAEVAIEVADPFHQFGIGSALAARTIQRARANGFALLTATTLRDSRAARGLLRDLGFRAIRARDGQVDYELELGAAPAA